MIDIHCHLLPGVDDGAEDWEACLEMARVAVADGVDTVIATPHWPGDDTGASRAESVLALTRAVQERLEAEAIPLRVLPGHELVILPELPDELDAGNALLLGSDPEASEGRDSRTRPARYALLEMPYQPLPFFLRDLIFHVQSRGITPVLAHPERNPTIQAKPQVMEDLVAAGCLAQVTAGSLLGQFGAASRKTAETLLRRGWAHVIASDAHSPRTRPPLLSGACAAAARLVGAETARRAVEAIPAAIACGARVDLTAESPAPTPPSLLRRLLGRL